MQLKQASDHTLLVQRRYSRAENRLYSQDFGVKSWIFFIIGISVTRSVVPRCTSEKCRSPRAVFTLASDGALTLYVHYRAPNQYHESFKTNSYGKFSKESIAI